MSVDHHLNPSKVASAEDLDALLGYSGSLQGTAVDEALDEQRKVL